jgi:hypothetical protein
MSYGRSSACKKLLAMPRIREVQLKEQWEEEDISLNRTQNIEAILGYSRGVVLDGLNKCEECQGKGKPFAECVVVHEFFSSSCCHGYSRHF